MLPEELIASIEKALDLRMMNVPRAIRPNTPDDEVRCLIQATYDLLRAHHDDPVVGARRIRQCLVRSLGAGPGRRIEVFIAVADALRVARGWKEDSYTNPTDLLGALEQHACSLVARITAGIGEPLALCFRKMDQEHAEDLARSEDEWSALVAMPATSFGRSIRSKTGLDFRTWRRAFRLRRALYLVYRTHEQVAQIASASGFSTASQFEREFKSVFGMTPKDCRALLRRPMEVAASS